MLTPTRFILLTTLVYALGCSPIKKDALPSTTGPTGPQGPPGANGEPGTAGLSISSSFSCFKTVSGNRYNYSSATYTTGDRWVTCGVDGISYSSSNTYLYRASQIGATTGSCFVTYDLDAASGGSWTFSDTSGTKQAKYTDVVSGSHNTTIVYTGAECSSF